jgi:shikimate dehydrogenase
VIDFLDELSPVVAQIKACNCIHIKEGRLIGYNTDVIGFSRSLEPQLRPHHTKALVLGTGGAAKAVHATLQEKGIAFVQVSRKASADAIAYEDIDHSTMEQYTLIINTTPLGMHPDTEGIPAIPYQFITPSHYLFDLVYNPAETRFLQEGQLRGASTKNGEDMLVIQAEASWEIWNA